MMIRHRYLWFSLVLCLMFSIDSRWEQSAKSITTVKLQAILQHLAVEAKRGRTSERIISKLKAAQGLPTPQIQNGHVQVIIEARTPADLLKLHEVLGANPIEVSYGSSLQAWVPLTQLESLGARSDVRFIRLPVPASLDQGAIVSEGVSLIGSRSWNNANFDGKGIKIGILDDGFYSYDLLLGRELPSRERVIAKSFRKDGEMYDPNSPSRHGTAMAEIIHDIAPGATLYLTAFATDLELHKAIGYLINEHVHIISTSFSIPSGCFSPEGGVYEPQIKEARQGGIFWSTSGGNDGDRHWEGRWRDDNGNRLHNFQGNDDFNTLSVELSEFEYPNGQRVATFVISGYFSWEADCKNASDDYEIVFFNEQGQELPPLSEGQGQLNEWAWGSGRPVKFFFATLDYPLSEIGSIKRIQLGIRQLRSGAPRGGLDIVWRCCDIQKYEYSDPRGSVSIFEPRISPNTFAVGAFHHDPSRCPSWAPCPSGLLSYSSRGPTKDGRLKPDITAPSHVSTDSYGLFRGGDRDQGFNGTSAAQPHAAGAAALVRQAFPNYTPEQIQKFLEDHAEDRGPPGKDNDWGAGQLILGQPPTQPTRPTAPSNLSTSARSPTAIDLTWRDNSSDEDGFEIERQLQGRDWQRITTVGRNVTNYSDTGLSPNTTYCHRVRAYNAAGSSDYSNTSCATTPRLNRDPIANAGPDQTVTAGTTVQLDGSRSSDPDGDPLTFRWAFISRPTGSLAAFSNPNIVNPTFVADLAGEYLIELTVEDGKGGRSSARVRITAINPPAIAVTPQRLEFTAVQGGPNPEPQTLQITNAGGSTLNWTAVTDAPWLKLSRDQGTAPSTVTVAVEIRGLAVTVHSARITITASGATNSPFTVAVILTIQPSQPPRIQVTPNTLAFQATLGSSAPPPQVLTITNVGGGVLNWTALTDVPWLRVTPMSGVAPPEARVNVSVETNGLVVGKQEGRIIVTAPDAPNSPMIVPVTLHIVGTVQTLLSLKFTQVSFATSGWNRQLRVGCVTYKNDIEAKIQLTLTDGRRQEYTIPAGREALICNDLIHLEGLGEPRALEYSVIANVLPLALKFIKLEMGDPTYWERSTREGCLVYKNIQADPKLLKVTLSDGTVHEFSIPTGEEFFVCSDVVHLE